MMCMKNRTCFSLSWRRFNRVNVSPSGLCPVGKNNILPVKFQFVQAS